MGKNFMKDIVGSMPKSRIKNNTNSAVASAQFGPSVSSGVTAAAGLVVAPVSAQEIIALKTENDSLKNASRVNRKGDATATASPAAKENDFEAEWAGDVGGCRAKFYGAEAKANYISFRKWQAKQPSKVAPSSPPIYDFEDEWASDKGGCRAIFGNSKSNFLGYRKWETSKA